MLEVREDVRELYRTILDAQASLKRRVRARVEVDQVAEVEHDDSHADESFAQRDH